VSQHWAHSYRFDVSVAAGAEKEHDARVSWVALIVSLPAFGYGLLNVVTPRTTVAWQVTATARARERDPRKAVGAAFERWLGIDPAAPPDHAVLRRIRILGAGEIAVAALYCALVIYAAS
jgi:hypothetical protein